MNHPSGPSAPSQISTDTQKNVELLQEIPPKLPENLHVHPDTVAKLIADSLKTKREQLSGLEAKTLLQAYGFPVTAPDMVSPPDYELQIGSRMDPEFGPVLFFGLGGRLGEAMADRCIALPPLNRLMARQMMEATRGIPCAQRTPRATPRRSHGHGRNFDSSGSIGNGFF